MSLNLWGVDIFMFIHAVVLIRILSNEYYHIVVVQIAPLGNIQSVKHLMFVDTFLKSDTREFLINHCGGDIQKKFRWFLSRTAFAMHFISCTKIFNHPIYMHEKHYGITFEMFSLFQLPHTESQRLWRLL